MKTIITALLLTACSPEPVIIMPNMPCEAQYLNGASFMAQERPDGLALSLYVDSAVPCVAEVDFIVEGIRGERQTNYAKPVLIPANTWATEVVAPDADDLAWASFDAFADVQLVEGVLSLHSSVN